MRDRDKERGKVHRKELNIKTAKKRNSDKEEEVAFAGILFTVEF